MLLMVAASLVAALASGLIWATRSESKSDNGIAPMQGNFTLGQAKGFGAFPLYNAGSSVAGYQLNAIERTVDAEHGTESITFLYGDCIPPQDPADGSYDGGCFRFRSRSGAPARANQRSTVAWGRQPATT